MKELLLKITTAFLALIISTPVSAQTSGTLTFTFTEIAKTPTYNGNSQHVLAAWIQTSAGAFIKTKLRYAGSGTSDHLPTWAVNSGGTAANCMAVACNTVDGTTGATRATWTTYSISWDGKKGAAATGTLQPDGVYKVSIQSTWNHGATGTALTTYTFTKGPSIDYQTPAANATYSNVILHWDPLSTGVDEAYTGTPAISVYPNPTTGVFSVDFENANNIKVINALGVLVREEKITDLTQGTKSIDLSNCANGIYMISVSNENGASNHKIILNR